MLAELYVSRTVRSHRSLDEGSHAARAARQTGMARGYANQVALLEMGCLVQPTQTGRLA